jgi:UDP:flavonoid glycosyltransferase YjiC (YdhE family)
MAKILMATYGSLGDLFPFLALGMELQRRGHQVTLAGPHLYRDKVESHGFGFAVLPPVIEDRDEMERLIQRVFHPTQGTEILYKEVLMPHVEATFDVLRPLAEDADLLVSHPCTYALGILGEWLGKPWASTALQPILFLSSQDPPVPAPTPWMAGLRGLPPWFWRSVWWVGKTASRGWARPVERLRERLGLPPGEHPIFEGSHSPHLGLAMFSGELAAPQPDWPRGYVICGFPFYDAPFEQTEAQQAWIRRIEDFLAAGDPPVVFTLGSSAVYRAGRFYEESVGAVLKLGLRAILLTGPKAELPPLPDSILAVEYAPHALVFPKASVNVHQGGAGTMSQAMRAGRPMLVVPHGHDQVDHAVRARRAGWGNWLMPRDYRAARVARMLRSILEDPAITQRAQAAGEAVRAENGPASAVDALERLLGQGSVSASRREAVR